jgi:hypothetical protein
MSYKAFVVCPSTRIDLEIIGQCAEASGLFFDGAWVLTKNNRLPAGSLLLLVTADRIDLGALIREEFGFKECQIRGRVFRLEEMNSYPETNAGGSTGYRIRHAQPVVFEPLPETEADYLALVANRFFPVYEFPTLCSIPSSLPNPIEVHP